MIENRLDAAIDISYLVAAVLFILGLKGLSSPATARRGNQLAAVGMAVAVIATMVTPGLENHLLMIVAMAIGAVLSIYAAQTVKMTAMPQMVAIFNGTGGAASALVAVAEFMNRNDLDRGGIVTIVLGTIVGAISFTGSMVAYAKLQELMPGRPVVYPAQQIVNAALGIAIVVLSIMVVLGGDVDLGRALLVGVLVLALVLGALVVLPIGGADMPVVIAIQNSLTGVASVFTGLVLSNQALVVAGLLVGASGVLLSSIMAKAMNRSLTNVLFGAFGSVAAGGGGAAAQGEALPVRSVTPEDAAVPLAYAERVVIVPGYGLAVAQAQHVVRELADLLEQRGVDVRYAIHPVAGRMPGHMNVLLAEANVSYDDLYEMDVINGEFAKTNVALVVGANDVTNPAARSNPGSPIYGMPILDVDQAQQVIVLKRSMKSGFAGIENELFHKENTSMLFGDAKESLGKLVAAVKAA
ncbi:MAG: NAD(P) transhydrogenase subunit beta [uncultured Thermomicrobiales bacterium]|uniref:NAD(P) transhydrogenase subunit beta n=1 Tax=uncultured Thermomicrobiales bacterium TaxID=1645740 RepID=A0A6J4VRQ6_9BACT|nr:MAG: NAD(P) transhydrogenase subunit beta [uncultured Thermomicrobiales bacterium]